MVCQAAGLLVYGAFFCREEVVFKTLAPQALQQVEDLLGPTVDLAAGFDMENPRLQEAALPLFCASSPPINLWAACKTSSSRIARMQSNLPSHVGRRLQGEHACL